jgi:LysM repeat protein
MTVPTKRVVRRQFKIGILAVVTAHLGLFAVLLIQGCKSEQSTIAKPGIAAPTTPSPKDKAAPEEQKPETDAAHATAAAPAGAETPAGTDPSVAAAKGETIYLVKSGDTLAQIAKAHGTTVKAIKAANNLVSERLAVGAKLKMPDAKNGAGHAAPEV